MCINSTLYKQWRNVGFLISVVFPFIMLMVNPFAASTIPPSVIAAPLFLLSCQLATEIASKQYLVSVVFVSNQQIKLTCQLSNSCHYHCKY